MQSQSGVEARLRGRWLALGRGSWLGLVVVTLAIFFGSLPIYLAQLQTPCAGAYCEYYQLPPQVVQTLQHLGWSLGGYAALEVALMLSSVGVTLGVSALIVWRRSDDRMALLVALLLVTLGPISATSSLPTGFSFWQIANEAMSYLGQVLLLLVFLLFPTGHFAPRWTRWIIPVVLVVQAPLTFLPLSLFGQATALTQPGWLVSLGMFAMLGLVQLYRYRRVSTPLQRQQTKWVVFGFASAILLNLLANLLTALPALAAPDSLFPLVPIEVGFTLTLLPPLSFGVAMLRYRLWDIDAIINRALVYGLLTFLLGALYVGLILGLTSLASQVTNGSSDEPIALVVSTLAIAALVLPVRRRIQTLIDRRFYRYKYDAAKTLAAFSATLRDEVNLEEIRERLLAVVQETMQPAHISLWLRAPDPPGDDPTRLLDATAISASAPQER
ncbi:MAG TPA: hypothetical protein VKT82_24740 [Ktedonobacterales bacterium]|nr:hypothetical protein [Ktedonobacterales bacterium]